MNSNLPSHLATLKLGRVRNTFWFQDATVLRFEKVGYRSSEVILPNTQTMYNGDRVFTPGYTKTSHTLETVATVAYPNNATTQTEDRRVIENVSPGDRIAFVYCNGHFVGLVNRTQDRGQWWNVPIYRQTQTLVRFRDYFRPFYLVLPLLISLIIYFLPSNVRYRTFPSEAWTVFIIAVTLSYFLAMALINNTLFWYRKRLAVAHVKTIASYILANR